MLRVLGLETAEESGAVSLGNRPSRSERLAIRVPSWLVAAGASFAISRLEGRARLIYGLAFSCLLSALPLDEGVARATRHGAIYGALLGLAVRCWPKL